MKHLSCLIFLLAIVLIASCATAPEPVKTASVQTPPAAQSSANAEQEVRKMIDDWIQADKNQDKNWFAQHYADNIIDTDLEGELWDKQKTLQALDPNDKLESNIITETKFQTYGDVVVATYKATAKGKTKTENWSGVYRLTTVWKKNAGNWQLVARHISQLKDKK